MNKQTKPRLQTYRLVYLPQCKVSSPKWQDIVDTFIYSALLDQKSRALEIVYSISNHGMTYVCWQIRTVNGFARVFKHHFPLLQGTRISRQESVVKWTRIFDWAIREMARYAIKLNTKLAERRGYRNQQWLLILLWVHRLVMKVAWMLKLSWISIIVFVKNPY